MLRARFHRTGNPSEVLELEEFTLPEPGPSEVRLRWLAAPINPADLNFIQGNYGTQPNLPATPGSEGVAQVEAVGSEVHHLGPGDPVLARSRLGSWASHSLAPTAELWPIPPDLFAQAPAEQWAQARINPQTAWHLLQHFVTLQPEDITLINAANSAVGQCLLQIARLRHLKIAAFARRRESLDALRPLHPEALHFTDDPAGWDEARQALAEQSIPLAANCVGGDSALNQLKLLSPGGSQITYGSMARQPTRLPAGLLIFKELHLHGLWITRFLGPDHAQELEQRFSQIAQWLAQGQLHLPVEASHPLTHLQQAIEQATQPHRQGKIIVNLSA